MRQGSKLAEASLSTKLDSANPWWPMEEARLLARLGRCDEARARFAEAERLCAAAGEFDCETWLEDALESFSECF